MGFELRREIRDLLPRGGVLTDKECRLILELADNANDESRRAWPGIGWLADVCDIPNPKRVGEFLTSIARKWVELRVELGKDRHGKPYFAKSGHQTVYRFPTRDELKDLLEADQVPAKGGAEVPPKEGAQVPAKGGPFSSGSPQRISSKNPSSLSPALDGVSAPRVPEPWSERETVDASLQEPQPHPDNPVHGLLLAAGCPPEKLNDVKNLIELEHQPRSNAWWRTVAANGDLPGIVADAFDTETLSAPVMSNSAWIATLTDKPACQHGTAGGNLQRGGDGWLACAFCRVQSGWSAKDHQPRTESRGAGGRSTSVVRAEQGLRVAAELDNLSPADRRVRDAQPLYDHYKALETRNNKHDPYRNPPIEAYYEPL